MKYRVYVTACRDKSTFGINQFRLMKSAVSIAQAMYFIKEFTKNIRNINCRSNNKIYITNGVIIDIDDDVVVKKYSVQSNSWKTIIN